MIKFVNISRHVSCIFVHDTYRLIEIEEFGQNSIFPFAARCDMKESISNELCKQKRKIAKIMIVIWCPDELFRILDKACFTSERIIFFFKSKNKFFVHFLQEIFEQNFYYRIDFAFVYIYIYSLSRRDTKQSKNSRYWIYLFIFFISSSFSHLRRSHHDEDKINYVYKTIWTCWLENICRYCKIAWLKGRLQLTRVWIGHQF